MSSGLALVADIGGTNARFAPLRDDGTLGEVVVLRTTSYPDLAGAIDAFRREARIEGEFGRAAICGAGPVIDQRIHLTNCPWKLHTRDIARSTGAPGPILVNDFTAVAHALAALTREDLQPIGGGEADEAAARAVLGPGTGLGVSGLLRAPSGAWIAVEGEGGHVSLSAASPREYAVVDALIRAHGHVSAERVLSGPGLQALYSALASIDGCDPAQAPSPEEIVRLAQAPAAPLAAETLDLFTAWLGAVAGDLALTLGARGGVYIAGGIVPAWGKHFDAHRFRERFEAKGRFRAYLEAIPTWVIVHPYPALVGLRALLERG